MAEVSNAGSVQSIVGSKNALVVQDITFTENNCWNRRSGLEKSLIVLGTILLLAAVGLLVGLVFVSSKWEEERKANDLKSKAHPVDGGWTDWTETIGQCSVTCGNGSLPIIWKRSCTEPKRISGGKKCEGNDRQVQLVECKRQACDPEICLTGECVKTASELLQKLNTDVRPCDDMYEFACGGWIKTTEIPESRASRDLFYDMSVKLGDKLKALLQDPKKDSEPEAFHKAKDLYASCSNLEKIEERDMKPMIDYMEELGGWPVLDTKWNETTFDLVNVLVSFVHYNNIPILNSKVMTDFKNSSVNILYVDQPGYGMPGRSYYHKGRNNTLLISYENMIVKVAVALGADPSTAKQEIKDVVDFEYNLANITVPYANRRNINSIYFKTTIKELGQNYSDFDWLKYFQNNMAIEGVETPITQEEPVVNQSPSYFERLFPLLASTPKRVLANYIMWMMVQPRMKSLSKRFRDIQLEYRKVIYGSKTQSPRWQECVGYVNRVLPMALSRMYIDVAFKESAKTATIELIVNIREVFYKTLKTNNWMDAAARKEAIDKADKMKSKVGYPGEIKNDTYLNNLYRKYNFSKDTYFENIVASNRQNALAYLRKLRQPVDNSRWFSSPAGVNGYYSVLWNEYVLLAGILQPPFYNEDQPNSLNYGSLGAVIAHEITHGFDTTGRFYDQDGHLREWWTAEVLNNFRNKTSCYIQQFSKFVVPEINMTINPIQTLNENLGDDGGVKQSYKAYRKWIAKRGKEEPLLPGLSYTNDQLYFIAWAQTWCSKMRRKHAINMVNTNKHSPHRFRVIGPLQNSKEFSDAFKCTPNSYMNPDVKCNLW